MGLFGDFFSDPWFDLNGDGKVDMFEEMIAFDMLFGDGDKEDSNNFDDGFDDGFDDPFAPDDFGDFPF